MTGYCASWSTYDTPMSSFSTPQDDKNPIMYFRRWQNTISRILKLRIALYGFFLPLYNNPYEDKIILMESICVFDALYSGFIVTFGQSWTNTFHCAKTIVNEIGTTQNIYNYSACGINQYYCCFGVFIGMWQAIFFWIGERFVVIFLAYFI